MSDSSGVVYVFAPQGAGKSRHAAALAEMFGCTRIVDGWDGVSVPPDGALVLSNRVPGVELHAEAPVSRFDVDAFVRDRMDLLTRRGVVPEEKAKAIVDSDLQMLRCDPKQFKRKFAATGLGRR